MQTCKASGSGWGTCAGCGTELPDGIVMVTDMGSGTCGNCDGCCNGPVCVPFAQQNNSTCGPRGEACQACPGTKVCGAGTGTCLDSSAGCGACGGGCCKNNVCLLNQPAACGASCTQCTYGVTCDGACTNKIDPAAQFRVYVKSADTLVNSTNCTNNWDYFNDPDLLVCVGYQSGGNFYESCNTHDNDRLNATWDDTTGLIQSGGSPLLVPGSVIIAGKMRITLYDYDYPDPNDLMAQGYYPATANLIASYATGAFGCANNIVFELR
jgi:hypothetical protein